MSPSPERMLTVCVCHFYESFVPCDVRSKVASSHNECLGLWEIHREPDESLTHTQTWDTPVGTQVQAGREGPWRRESTAWHGETARGMGRRPLQLQKLVCLLSPGPGVHQRHFWSMQCLQRAPERLRFVGTQLTPCRTKVGLLKRPRKGGRGSTRMPEKEGPGGNPATQEGPQIMLYPSQDWRSG